MWFASNRRTRSWILTGFSAVVFVGLGPSLAASKSRLEAAETHQAYASSGASSAAGLHRQSARRNVEPKAGQYFVEFRSRYALSYGHTFLVHGQLNSRGEVGQVTADQVAGLHPAGEGPQLWSVGHVLPVPAETGPSDGDMEDEYISNRFRVVMDEAQYRRVAAYIRRKQKAPTMWHAVLYNCNRWVGEVAEFMGLEAPSNALLYPPDYISSLRALNAGKVPEPQLSAQEQ